MTQPVGTPAPIIEQRPLDLGIEKPAPASKESTPSKDTPKPVKAAGDTKETPKEVVTPVVKDDTASRLALLSQKERNIRAREHKVTEESKALDTTKQQISHLKEDPLGTIEQVAGLTFKELVDLNLKRIEKLEKEGKDPNADPKIQAMETKLAAMEKAAAERTEKETRESQVQAWNNHLNECSKIVTASPDDFETINADPDEATQIYSNLFVEFYKIVGRDPVRKNEDGEDEVTLLLKRTEEMMEEKAYSRLTKYEPLKKLQARKAKLAEEAAAKAKADKEAGNPNLKKTVDGEESEEAQKEGIKKAVSTKKVVHRTITTSFTPSGETGTASKNMSREERIAAIAKRNPLKEDQ